MKIMFETNVKEILKDIKQKHLKDWSEDIPENCSVNYPSLRG